MNYILTSILVLGCIALLASVVLYVCSKKFAVKTDPRIAQVFDLLPKANCGGCGLAGCQAMAEALVADADKGGNAGLTCPVGGSDAMGKIAALLGTSGSVGEERVAVVRCSACFVAHNVEYDGLRTCSAMHASGSGEGGCANSCLGCGDCQRACSFGAISIDEEKQIARIDEDKCAACGACAKACPRGVIELRPKGKKGRRVYVACRNQERGPVAKAACTNACIGCKKCEKECPFGAITVENNLAYIDYTLCRSCRKCVAVCPQHAIHAVGFPAPRITAPQVTGKADEAKTTTSAQAEPQAQTDTTAESTDKKQ